MRALAQKEVGEAGDSYTKKVGCRIQWIANYYCKEGTKKKKAKKRQKRKNDKSKIERKVKSTNEGQLHY